MSSICDCSGRNVLLTCSSCKVISPANHSVGQGAVICGMSTAPDRTTHKYDTCILLHLELVHHGCEVRELAVVFVFLVPFALVRVLERRVVGVSWQTQGARQHLRHDGVVGDESGQGRPLLVQALSGQNV